MGTRRLGKTSVFHQWDCTLVLLTSLLLPEPIPAALQCYVCGTSSYGCENQGAINCMVSNTKCITWIEKSVIFRKTCGDNVDGADGCFRTNEGRFKCVCSAHLCNRHMDTPLIALETGKAPKAFPAGNSKLRQISWALLGILTHLLVLPVILP